MPRYSLYALMTSLLFLSACAAQKSAERAPVKNTTVIAVAKNGALTVDRKPVKLHSLVNTLKAQGFTKNAKLAVEGDPGADQKEIERVMETLVDAGLLPKGTID